MTTAAEATEVDTDEGKAAWLSKINAGLEDTGVVVYDREHAVTGNLACQRLHAEIDCTTRVYECLVPLEYFLPTEPLESLASRLKPILRSLSSPKSATHGGFRGRRADVQRTWRDRHAWHNFADSPAVPTDAAVRWSVDRFWLFGPGGITAIGPAGRRFVRLRVSADGVLRGQVERMIGLAICIYHGWLDAGVAALALDPSYLLVTPRLPSGLLVLHETRFDWHHKAQRVLRVKARTPATQAAMTAFETNLVEEIAGSDAASPRTATAWCDDMRDTMCPRIREQAAALRTVIHAPPLGQSHHSASAALDESRSPELLDDAPPVYRKVLELLREADASGRWPSTPKARMRVLSAEGTHPLAGGTLSVFSPARARQVVEALDEATRLEEADALRSHGGSTREVQRTQRQPPPQQAQQLPRGNLLFPELVAAAFELERLIAPFGQSLSLIVGLGDYKGGELVVEGAVTPIRYAPLEFDGWRERHWTKPFVGERFSLVWFSPAEESSTEGQTPTQRYAQRQPPGP